MARLLIDYLEVDYFRLNLKIRDERSRNQYRRAIKNLGLVLGYAPTVVDLSDDNVTRLIAYLLDTGREPGTANTQRGKINAFWTWLAKRGQCQTWPTVTPIPQLRKTPRAWSRRQLHRLWAQCCKETGDIDGVPAAIYWRAIHAVFWDTGERTGAVLRITPEMFDSEQRVLHIPGTARKGKCKDAVYKLARDTSRLLSEVIRANPKRKRIFGFNRQDNGFYTRYEKLLTKAGLPSGRYCKPQKMRRSFASWIAAKGGDASQALGHEDARTTKDHYLDPSICRKRASAKLFRLQ